MDGISLLTLADELLAKARSSSSGRSARTIHGGRGHTLRQTVIALVGERALGEHESPGEATLQVLLGRVQLHAGGEIWEGAAGGFVEIPPERHDLAALEDSVVILSVATSQP